MSQKAFCFFCQQSVSLQNDDPDDRGVSDLYSSSPDDQTGRPRSNKVLFNGIFSRY